MPAPGPAGAFLLGWLARPLLGALIGLPLRLALRFGLGALLVALPVAGAPALTPAIGHLLPAAVHAQEAPGGAGAEPAPPTGPGGPGGAGWVDLVRAVGDVLGGVRTIATTTDRISDATRIVSDFVARLASLTTEDWFGLVWKGFAFVALRLAVAVVGLMHGLLDALLGSALNFISQTPESVSYGSPAVRDLWGRMRQLANAGLAVVALVGGLNVVLHNRLGTPYHEAMAFLPRLAVGAVLANTSLQWTGLAIEANNVASAAVGRAPLPGWEQAGMLSHAWLDLALGGVYLFVALLLLVQMLLRLALVDLLIVVSPLAMVLWVLPQTEGWARRWTASFAGFVFAQFVQVIAIRLGSGLTLQLSGLAPDAVAVGLLAGITTLGLTLKVPSLLNAHIDDGMSAARRRARRAAGRLLPGP